MKGGETCLDNVRDNPPVRPRKHGPEVRQTPRWSAGGCACRSHGAQHRKVPDEDHSALPALRSLTWVREGKRRRSPKRVYARGPRYGRTNNGDDETRL